MIRAGFIIWHSARALRSDSKFFFVLYLYLAERCCKNSQTARGLASYKSGPGIVWFVSATIYCIIFNNNSPTPRQFLRTKYF